MAIVNAQKGIVHLIDHSNRCEVPRRTTLGQNANLYVKLDRRGRVAQLVEQCPFKAWVEGSSPSALTIPRSEVHAQVRFVPRHLVSKRLHRLLSSKKNLVVEST